MSCFYCLGTRHSMCELGNCNCWHRTFNGFNYQPEIPEIVYKHPEVDNNKTGLEQWF